MDSGNFNKKLYNALAYRPILVHLIIILKLTHLHNRLLSGSNARHFSNWNEKSVQLKNVFFYKLVSDFIPSSM